MQVEDHEWFIVQVSKVMVDNIIKLSKRVYNRIEGNFSSKKRERYFKDQPSKLEVFYCNSLLPS